MSLSSSKSLTITSISSTAHVWHLGSSLLLLSHTAQYGISQTGSGVSGVAGSRSNGKNFISLEKSLLSGGSKLINK